VDSELGKGATFWFNLSFKIAKEPIENTANPVETMQVVNLGNKKLLVVDDNLLNLKLAVQVLKRLNVNVTTVISGQEAVTCLKSETFDAILLDIHMPDMNGFDTFQAIRELGIKSPIIALTADTFEETRLEIERFGFEAILLKPYNINELKELLQRVIN
jgi:CheY-like chemotaxis protein